MRRLWNINGRFLHQPLTGVQRYAFEIVSQVSQLVSEEHPLTRDLELQIVAPPGPFSIEPPVGPPVRTAGRRGSGHVWEQAVLPRQLRGGGLLSLCNTGPVAVSRQIVCLHDVNTRSYPQSYSLPFRSLYRVLQPLLGRRVRLVSTVSDYSAGQLVSYGIAPRRRIRVMPNGHEHAGRWIPQHSERTREFADGRTVVAIGSPAPHKNIGLLLGIASRLEQANLRLAIVGKRDTRVFSDVPGLAASAGNVTWLGHLDDREIAALLGDALCLAFPSFAEGFGIPALEAMVCDCPVVVSDRTSLPEVCGDAALYASPDAPREWLAQIGRLASDATLREDLMQKGKLQARNFSWRASAIKYLEAMAEIDGVSETGRPA